MMGAWLPSWAVDFFSWSSRHCYKVMIYNLVIYLGSLIFLFTARWEIRFRDVPEELFMTGVDTQCV
jgi:hypothetical protein